MTSSSRALVFVAAIATAVRVGALAVCGARQQPLEPSVIAANLNAGRGLTFEQYGATYRAWKEPLYIVGLAAVMRAWPHPAWPIAVLQCLFGVMTAVGVAALAWRLFGDTRRALIAGSLAALNPFLLYYEVRWIHSLSFDSFLFIATTLATLHAITTDRAPMRSAARAGLVTAVALWERSSLFATGCAAWFAGIVTAPRLRRRIIQRAAIVWTLVALTAFSPWLIRNYRLFGRVIITTDAAHIFWLGNNPWSNGTYSDSRGHRIIEQAPEAFQRQLAASTEPQQYDLFRRAALSFIREHPARFAQLIVARLWAFVWFSPNAGVEYTQWQQWIYRAAYVPLLMLGLTGFAISCRHADPMRRRDAWLIAAAVSGLAVTHALMAINLKHRVPFELMLSLFAAEPLARLFATRHLAATDIPLASSEAREPTAA